MARYSNTPIVQRHKKNPDGTVSKIDRYLTSFYSRTEFTDEDMYFITQAGDRLDNLALQFYGNPHMWWYIARVNNLVTMNVEPGIRLRIPSGTGGSNVY